MSPTITVSNDVSRVTDMVMLRQLTPTPREQVEALVRMVLDCAAEAGPGSAENAPEKEFTAVLTDVEEGHGRSRAIFADPPIGSKAGRAFHVYTPALSTPEGRALTDRLKGMVGERVTATIRVEEAGPLLQRRVISNVQLSGQAES